MPEPASTGRRRDLVTTVSLRHPGRRIDRPRVLLLWPGGVILQRPNFGVPQLLCLASALEKQTDAHVDVVDLDMERLLGPVDLSRLLQPGYDLVGISCYSSYDVLKVEVLARAIKQQLPAAWLVTGGYHPSARPADFCGRQSPFDFVTVGDGEHPLVELVRAMADGKRPAERMLPQQSLADPSEVMPYPWRKLARYIEPAKERRLEVELYLSRGCPYNCSFCMERAKRDVSWRALSPLDAVQELHRADRDLDLRGRTLRILDPLFGLRDSWRKEFLAALADKPLRAEKVWLVLRADLIDREDMVLMARANVACGFGLESGDPDQLLRIRKTGKLSGFLERMLDIAQWARELGVPWGANIITGHPGETESSMRVSATYMRKLFLDPRGSMGFLAADPFRLYPGAPIEVELDQWKRETGMRVHRYPWWRDGDQAFLSEWIDPSDSLTYARAEQLREELFAPVLRDIPGNFRYSGPGRQYMLRAPQREARQMHPDQFRRRRQLRDLWQSLSEAEAVG